MPLGDNKRGQPEEDRPLESQGLGSVNFVGSKRQKIEEDLKTLGGTDDGIDMTKEVAMDIDEDLHSRQLAVYGRESMRRMAAAKIVVVGLRGLGAEIAKNIILAGVSQVILHDPEPVQIRDLTANFYLTSDDVGKSRAEAALQRFKDLNKSVNISTYSDDLTPEFIKQNANICVFSEITQGSQAIELNEWCRAASCAFIKAESRGVFGSIFCDFGPNFLVVDTDGEEPHKGIIASISNENPALVTCIEDERLEFQDGDEVIFSEISGLTELNDKVPRRLMNCKANSFQVDVDTTSMGQYTIGGLVTQVKRPKTLNFKTLAEASKEPGEFLLSDFSKIDRPPLLHVAFMAIGRFEEIEKRLPNPGSADDADKVAQIAKEINGNMKFVDGELDEKVIRLLAHGATCEVNAMSAILGGIVGQEVLKASSGKFHPINQFFYFDSVESLQGELECNPWAAGDDFAMINCRYDDQIAVFGKSMQEKLNSLNLFVVGAGALGCEFLKNLALMGAGTSEAGGMITVTDDDTIERSNLSRQFLFRDHNIGQAKSTVASDAAKVINPDINIVALQNRVSPENETVFHDSFWESLDCVINALDNVKARLYVDSRCVYVGKPLLESGTLGTKCNTQMVIPRLTENYGASQDPPEKSAPMCTLHTFPHNIDHCLTWARSEFEGMLEKIPSEVNSFVESPDQFLREMKAAADAQSRETLQHILQCLGDEYCESYEDCIAWARRKFEDYFHNRITQLTYTFPKDSRTSTGTPFWSPPKRFPTAIVFSKDDDDAISLIRALANLRAETFGISKPDYAHDLRRVGEVASGVEVPTFVPKEGVRIETDPKKNTIAPTSLADDQSIVEEIAEKLEFIQSKLPTTFRMAPIEFEKDDDTNFHMDAIAGLANMRARNYEIPTVDKLKAKLIAGRIIPAIATTTAMATGFVMFELYKVINKCKVESYRNTFVNLAIPLFAMAEPIPSKATKFQNMEWSIWDRWILEGDLTLQELLKYFEDRELSAYSVSYGQALLYNSLFPRHKDRLGKKISDLVREVAKVVVPDCKNYLDIVVACEAEDENGQDIDVDVPLISVKFR